MIKYMLEQIFKLENELMKSSDLKKNKLLKEIEKYEQSINSILEEDEKVRELKKLSNKS